MNNTCQGLLYMIPFVLRHHENQKSFLRYLLPWVDMQEEGSETGTDEKIVIWQNKILRKLKASRFYNTEIHSDFLHNNSGLFFTEFMVL